MNDLSAHPRRLNQTANVLAIAGSGLLVVAVIQLRTMYGLAGFSFRYPFLLAVYGISIGFSLALPVMYILLSQPVRRAAYGAWVAAVTLVVLGEVRLVASAVYAATNPYMPAGFRYFIPVLIFFLVQGIMLGALLWVGPIVRQRADDRAIGVARVRASIALMLLAGVLLVAGLVVGAVGAMALEVDIRRGGGLDGIILLTVFVGVMIMLSLVVSSIRTVRRQERPGMVVILLLAALLLVMQSLGYFRFFFYGTNGRLVQNFVTAGLVWCLIELLHSRRKSAGQAGHGFEPIFARVVSPPPSQISLSENRHDQSA